MYKKVVYKHHNIFKTETGKEKAAASFLETLSTCEPSNIIKYKTVVRISFNDGKYKEVYTLPVKYADYIENMEELRKAKQYIADVYHCSECWGIKQTPEDMKANLTEWNLARDPGKYCPSVSLYNELAAYWNELCDMYPF